MLDVFVIIGLCVDQILPTVNYAFSQKTQLSCFACALCVSHMHIQYQYQTSQIFSKTVATQ